ncbi:thioredoxin family protein [Chitinimonas sp. JJ19]|uniref:thioredoxin family protein n=1 Tax=Chitinimonas sp. JJ19 TaxID=3109352 RepID=UPI003002E0CB
MNAVQTPQWDLWLDAARLAERLSQPDSQLIAVIGAEAWCQKCRQLKPLFETAAHNAQPNETWLWLDLEDHAEFIGPHIPDDLPTLLHYRQGKLIAHGTLPTGTAAFEPAMQAASQHAAKPDIGLFQRLTSANWSQGGI